MQTNSTTLNICDGKVEWLKQFNETAFEPHVPGSKSYTNRALIIGAYTLGKTRVKNALMCDDTHFLANALDSFKGLSVETGKDYFIVNRTEAELYAPSEPVYIGAAGTPARLLLSFAATVNGHTTITGNARLNERPMGDILDTFDRIGVNYKCLETQGCLPVCVSKSTPNVDNWLINGGVSSQFVSSLIHLAAFSDRQSVVVEIDDKLVSKPYVAMTLRMLESVGIEVTNENFKRFIIKPGKPSPTIIDVEVDASGMSYFLVAAAITGSEVKINKINESSAQGDVGLVEALRQMGCTVSYQADSITLKGHSLKGIEIDMDLMPDTVLSLAMAALYADSPTTITNIANLRVKECDRIAAIVEGVSRLGGQTEDGSDWITIYPLRDASACEIECYDDHRVAMSFSLLAFKGVPLTLSDYECVSKSFPDFWKQTGALVNHHR